MGNRGRLLKSVKKSNGLLDNKQTNLEQFDSPQPLRDSSVPATKEEKAVDNRFYSVNWADSSGASS